MKIKTMAIVVLMISVGSVASAKTQGNVYSPEQGVICDKKSGFCSDSYGISLGMTKDFLGQKAADKFTKILADKDFDATIYAMSNGLYCDTNKKICKKSKWDEKADAHWTAVLFGEKASQQKVDGGTDLVQAAKDCKNYLANKFDLPMAAFSINKGHNKHGAVIVPVVVKWDEPFVDEKGECKVHNGNISFRRTSN